VIWKKEANLQDLNSQSQNGAAEHLGIEITTIGDEYLTATMPVDHRTKQPYGLLHGGASVLLAETVGSFSGTLAAPEGSVCVGLGINASHLRGVTSGIVTATAKPVHIGRKTQVWQIDIVNDLNKAVCSSRLTLAVIPVEDIVK